jgi:hypothetical protein
MQAPLRPIFERFQNLNLVFLIEDLRRNLAATGNWAAGALLCPVAHGMRDGAMVQRLKYLSQAVDLDAACRCAALELGTQERIIRQFVDLWDSEPATFWLLEELEQIWAERVEDAQFVTEFLGRDDYVMVNDVGEYQLVGSPTL